MGRKRRKYNLTDSQLAAVKTIAICGLIVFDSFEGKELCDVIDEYSVVDGDVVDSLIKMGLAEYHETLCGLVAYRLSNAGLRYVKKLDFFGNIRKV